MFSERVRISRPPKLFHPLDLLLFAVVFGGVFAVDFFAFSSGDLSHGVIWSGLAACCVLSCVVFERRNTHIKSLLEKARAEFAAKRFPLLGMSPEGNGWTLTIDKNGTLFRLYVAQPNLEGAVSRADPYVTFPDAYPEPDIRGGYSINAGSRVVYGCEDPLHPPVWQQTPKRSTDVP